MKVTICISLLVPAAALIGYFSQAANVALAHPTVLTPCSGLAQCMDVKSTYSSNKNCTAATCICQIIADDGSHGICTPHKKTVKKNDFATQADTDDVCITPALLICGYKYPCTALDHGGDWCHDVEECMLGLSVPIYANGWEITQDQCAG